MKTMITLALAMAAAPARALDIAGKVVDRFWVGIADAKVCAQGGSPCAQSAADGSFRLQGPVSLRRAPGYAASSVSRVGSAERLEWRDAVGALIASPGLSPAWSIGPGGIPGGASLDLGGSGPLAKMALGPTVQLGPGSERPGGKVAFPLPLVATKAGFSAAAYSPGAEEEAGIFILLSPEGGNTVQLFNGRSFDGWDQSAKTIGGAPGSWIMQDGAFHSVGNIRGTLSTRQDFGSFRLLFTLRHLPSTGSDHQPCVVIWGTRPPPNDALGGIQFQPPNGGHWDYRPGKNNSGGGLFTKVAHTAIDRAKWAQCEIWAKQATGEARMACCNLGETGPCRGLEVLRFKDATAGRKGPLGLQIHNSGLHDQYKNISLEIDPKVDDLITTKL